MELTTQNRTKISQRKSQHFVNTYCTRVAVTITMCCLTAIAGSFKKASDHDSWVINMECTRFHDRGKRTHPIVSCHCVRRPTHEPSTGQHVQTVCSKQEGLKVKGSATARRSSRDAATTQRHCDFDDGVAQRTTDDEEEINDDSD